MIQESEKPYRTVKEKLSRGIVLIMSTTILKRQLINLKGMQTIILINLYMIQEFENLAQHSLDSVIGKFEETADTMCLLKSAIVSFTR